MAACRGRFAAAGVDGIPKGRMDVGSAVTMWLSRAISKGRQLGAAAMWAAVDALPAPLDHKIACALSDGGTEDAVLECSP